MIILAGGGTAEQSKQVDSFFVNALSKNKKIVYIPTALRGSSLEQCSAWFRKTYESLGVRQWETWVDLRDKKFGKDIGACYLGGGNTFYLLAEIRRTHFDKVLKDFIVSGGLVYGGSAGAVVLGKNISLVSDKNDSGIFDYRGLNILGGYSVFPHYKSERKKLLRESYRIGPILAIAEDAGATFDGLQFVSLGSGNVLYFLGGKCTGGVSYRNS
jgi:dipeptidase E